MSIKGKFFGQFVIEMSKNQERTIDPLYVFTSFISTGFDKIVKFEKTRLLSI